MPLPADGSKLKLGKGSLLLDQLIAGVAQGFDFAGNCSAITIAADVTTVQKFSSTQASAPLIGRSVTQVAYNMTATLDEFNFSMLKKFLLAEEATANQALDAAATLQIADVVVGRYYQLGARQVSAVVVNVGSTLMVLNTDYTLNSEFGIVRPIPGGAILDDDTLDVEWSQAALAITQLRLAKVASPVCHLLYLSDDANADGAAAQDRLEVWRVNIAPEGELNLISDDFGSYQLSMAVIDDSVNHPNDPFGVYERIAA